MYTINNTVEESVLSFATKRRLQLLQQAPDNEQRSASSSMSPMISDSKLDFGNSLELQKVVPKIFNKKTEGEVVPLDDLWDLFFGQNALNSVEMDSGKLPEVTNGSNKEESINIVNLEYRRFVMSEAAEKRLEG